MKRLDLVVGLVDRVRLRRDGQVDHALGQRQLAFGRAQALVDLGRVQRQPQRARVGQADVLAGHAHQPARHVARVGAAVEHAHEPVQRGIGVAAAHRLVQRARWCRRTARRPCRSGAGARPAPCSSQASVISSSFSALRGDGQRLERVEQAARIAVGIGDQPVDGRRRSMRRHRLDGLRPGRRSAAGRPRSSGCSTYTAARDSSAELTSKDGFSVVAPMKVNRPDSTCGRKASCWLLLKRCTSSTNTMVRRCSRPSRAAVRALDRLADVLHAAEHRADAEELRVEGVGHQPRDGGLADAGRAPQDAGMRLAGLEGDAQRHARAQQVLLADDLAQRLRAQAFGEGRQVRWAMEP